MSTPALLMIDIQNDYFPGGRMELDKAEEAAEKAGSVLAVFREKKFPVFHVQHESLHENATFFLPGTYGQKINDRVKPLEYEPVVVKHFPNSFVQTGLFELLKDQGITDLVITGMMTLMCVDATARAAKDLGFHCTVLHDATAARALEFDGEPVTAAQVKAAFLAALSMVCDCVTDADDYLASMV